MRSNCYQPNVSRDEELANYGGGYSDLVKAQGKDRFPFLGQRTLSRAELTLITAMVTDEYDDDEGVMKTPMALNGIGLLSAEKLIREVTDINTIS